MTTPTDISNDALDMIPSANVASLTDGTRQAALCARHYPSALAELMELAAWGVGVTRITLAETTNERPEEWAYAYARPSDAALVVALLQPAGETLGLNVRSPYEQVLLPTVPFADYGDKLYSNMAAAQVDYISGQIAAASFTALMRKALAAMLAARIALPLTKDEKKKALREEDAANAIQAAVAGNFNRQPQTYGDFVPDVLAARMGH